MNRQFSLMQLLLGAFFVVWCGSASAYVIGLFPSTGTHPPGAQFSMDVVMQGLETDEQILSTYDLTIGFDSSILQLVGVQQGDALGVGSLFLSTPGAGVVNLFEISALSDEALVEHQGDDLTLARLVFRGIDTGTSLITFSDIFALGGSQLLNPDTGEFETADLLALAHTVGSATTTILPGLVSEPGTFVLLALAASMLAIPRGQRRRVLVDRRSTFRDAPVAS